MDVGDDDVRSVLVQTFKRASVGDLEHERLAVELASTYAQTENQKAFGVEFVRLLKFALVVYKREPEVERIIDFAARFAASFNTDDDEHDCLDNFFTFFVDFLLKNHDAQNKAVRFRICHLVRRLFAQLGDKAVLDEVLDGLCDIMLERLCDRVSTVRQQAALALTHLQDPVDPNCPVTAGFMHLLERDPYPEVRRAVLLSLSPSLRSLPYMLGRTRDVHESVRKAAYEVLAKTVHIDGLKIAQRVSLVRQGLTDHSQGVRNTVRSRLLPAWLQSLNGEPLALLSRLDPESDIDASFLVLRALFANRACDVKREFAMLHEGLIPISGLTLEGALYWRFSVELLRETGGTQSEEKMEELLAEPLRYTKYLQDYICSISSKNSSNSDDLFCVDNIRKEMIAQQLVCLAKYLDLSDEAGRHKLLTTVSHLLSDSFLPLSLAPPLASLLFTLETLPDRRLQLVAEIVSELRDPFPVPQPIDAETIRHDELELARLRVRMHEMGVTLDSCVQAKEYERAAELKTELGRLQTSLETLKKQSDLIALDSTHEVEQKSDPSSLLRCLALLEELLKGCHPGTAISPILLELLNTLVLTGVTSEDPQVREVAVRCLGGIGLLSCPVAFQHLPLLLQMSQLDEEQVRVAALHSIFDFIQLFGLEALEPHDPRGSPTGDLKLDELEDSPKEHVEKAMATNILKLLTALLDSEACGRLASPRLLSRLLLLWHNPSAPGGTKLRSCLATFFPGYAAACRSNRDVLANSLLPTLRTLHSAPISSPLASVEPLKVVRLVVGLSDTSPSNTRQWNSVLAQEDMSVHESLALQLCNALLEELNDPETKEAKTSWWTIVLLKALAMLHVSGTEHSTMQHLQNMLQRIKAGTGDRICKQLAKKAMTNLCKNVQAARDCTALSTNGPARSAPSN
uniref:condensin complex subunit 3 isoform X2 n=1 Tax=Myxine glutinosa TaxID=7769 RepID=UPI00358FB5A9